MNRTEAVEIALERDQGCICRTWSHYACVGKLDGDEPERRSQGADPCNPDEIQILCRKHHDLKDSVMRKGAKVLGLSGKDQQDFEQFVFYQETPLGDWSAYVESWRASWNSEYAYMTGQGDKPTKRYSP